mgnify:CR=1 FL=1
MTTIEKEIGIFSFGHVISGLGGGMPGGRLLSYTLLVNQGLPNLRTKVGMFAHGVVFLVAWIFDPPIARYIPRCFAAGLMIYIGLSLILEFAWNIRARVTPQDYGLVLVTAVLVLSLGMNEGLILSILASVVRQPHDRYSSKHYGSF